MQIKLLVLVLPLVIALVFSSAFYSTKMNQIAEKEEQLFYNKLYEISQNLLNADRDYYQAMIAVHGKRNAGAHLTAKINEQYQNSYAENAQQVLDNVNAAAEIAKKEKSLWNKKGETGITFGQIYDKFVEEFDKWQGSYNVEDMSGNFVTFQDNFDSTRERINEMSDIVVEWAVEQDKAIKASIKKTIITTAIIFVVVSVLLLVFALLVSSSIAKAMKDMTKRIEVLAKNDLSQAEPNTNQKDEIGQMLKAFATMQGNLTGVIGTLKNTTDDLARSCEVLDQNTEAASTSMDHINRAAGELAQTATQQAEDVSDVSRSMDDLSNIMNRSVQTADELNEASKQINSVTKEGVDTVEDLTTINNKSLDAFESIFAAIDNIQESADKISGASDLIQAVSEQTNLLSLNASIEAARAGDAGKGFAVVAEEIRKLSDESAASVETINKLLEELQDNTKGAIEKSNLVKDLVEQQNVSVQNTKGNFENLVDTVGIVENAIGEIHSINAELDEGIKGILGLVENLSAASQENAATAEELSATSDVVTRNVEELRDTQGLVNDAANDLERIIQQFKLAGDIENIAASVVEEEPEEIPAEQTVA